MAGLDHRQPIQVADQRLRCAVPGWPALRPSLLERLGSDPTSGGRGGVGGWRVARAVAGIRFGCRCRRVASPTRRLDHRHCLIRECRQMSAAAESGRCRRRRAAADGPAGWARLAHRSGQARPPRPRFPRPRHPVLRRDPRQRHGVRQRIAEWLHRAARLGRADHGAGWSPTVPRRRGPGSVRECRSAWTGRTVSGQMRLCGSPSPTVCR